MKHYLNWLVLHKERGNRLQDTYMAKNHEISGGFRFALPTLQIYKSGN
jgi:hypothetical protein